MPVEVSSVVAKPFNAAIPHSLEHSPPTNQEEDFRYWSKWLIALIPLWISVSYITLDEPSAALSNYWPLFVVGIIGAIIGNITAIGGGLVFVPFTMLVYDMDAVTSLKLAIACQAFGMTSGTIAWWHRNKVPKQTFLSLFPAILGGCLVGGLILPVDGALVKGLFGPVSVIIGLCTLAMLYYPLTNTQIKATPGLHLTSAAGGLLTAWVAIGIGEAIAAYLMIRHRTCAERSIALGVTALSLASICLFTIFSLSTEMPWPQIACMALGCIFGGRLAPLISRRISHRSIKLFFGIIALGDGALFIYNYSF